VVDNRHVPLHRLPGDSASHGCVVGALVAPGLIASPMTVPLLPPGTEETPRVNQLGLSVAKRIKIGSLDPKIDMFNALNSSDYFTVRTQTFLPTSTADASSGRYLYPGSILQADSCGSRQS
jgi:hypothetical protein